MMEELLNKLIEKGWKPFGRNYERYEHGCLIHEVTTKDLVYSYGQYPTTLREFCVKESGLWQFVCENKLVKTKDKKVRYRYEDLEKTQNYFSWYGYEYRLIESALKDESELEKFLIDNIKV